jgi:hypothetical protein
MAINSGTYQTVLQRCCRQWPRNLDSKLGSTSPGFSPPTYQLLSPSCGPAALELEGGRTGTHPEPLVCFRPQFAVPVDLAASQKPT